MFPNVWMYESSVQKADFRVKRTDYSAIWVVNNLNQLFAESVERDCSLSSQLHLNLQ